MTTATFSHLTHTLTDSFPHIDTAFLQTAAAVISAVAASAFVLSILASVQAGL
jgi:hypothetical protein